MGFEWGSNIWSEQCFSIGSSCCVEWKGQHHCGHRSWSFDCPVIWQGWRRMETKSDSILSDESWNITRNPRNSPTVTLALGAPKSKVGLVRIFTCSTVGCIQKGKDIIGSGRFGNSLSISIHACNWGFMLLMLYVYGLLVQHLLCSTHPSEWATTILLYSNFHGIWR